MNSDRLPERVQLLPNNSYVVSTLAGAILVNCPPETLKTLILEGVSVPAIILLPPDIPPGQQLSSSGFVRQGVNYASVEFLIYSNFFGHGGRKVQLITVTEYQAVRLERILEETISGPTQLSEYGEFAWLQRECAAVSYFPPLGRAPHWSDMATIESLEAHTNTLDPVHITLEDQAFVFRELGEIVARVPIHLVSPPFPQRLAPPRPLLRQELTLQFIGGSDGFDPSGITTCFLAYLGASVQTRATLFDAAAYLSVRLGNLGIAPNQISEVFLSHLHEDHLAGLPDLLLASGHRVRLITSTLIYRSLLRVLSAQLAVRENEVAALFDYCPINPGQPLDLDGHHYEAIYAVHSIPTIAVRVNGLCYSGDMRYDEEWFATLEAQGVLSPERRSELVHFAEGASVLVQDVGGGPIHSTITPALLHALMSKSQRLVLAHTSKHLLPDERTEFAGRIEFAGSGHVVSVGEVVAIQESAIIETISACPLFSRLPMSERLRLATVATLTTWANAAVIAHEGAPSDQTFIVHSGLVEVWHHNERLHVVSRGSSLGERGALQGDPRAATLIAHGPTQLLSFDRASFRPVAERLGLIEAFAHADWLGQQPVFINMTWASLLDLALDMQPRHLAAGEQLFAYGDLGDESYVLVQGTLTIFDRDGILLGTLSRAGEFFGARAPLYGKVRNATVVAHGACDLLALPVAAIERLHLLYPNLLLHLRVIEATRNAH